MAATFTVVEDKLLTSYSYFSIFCVRLLDCELCFEPNLLLSPVYPLFKKRLLCSGYVRYAKSFQNQYFYSPYNMFSGLEYITGLKHTGLS